jgi:hypothetical protein
MLGTSCHSTSCATASTFSTLPLLLGALIMFGIGGCGSLSAEVELSVLDVELPVSAGPL